MQRTTLLWPHHRRVLPPRGHHRHCGGRRDHQETKQLPAEGATRSENITPLGATLEKGLEDICKLQRDKTKRFWLKISHGHSLVYDKKRGIILILTRPRPGMSC